MGFHTYSFKFKISRKKLINFLITGEPMSFSTEEGQKLSLNGVSGHGCSTNIADGTVKHVLSSHVGFGTRLCYTNSIYLHSLDGGKNFEGSVSFNLYPDDNYCE